MTGLDVGIEAKVGANPSCMKFSVIYHGNPVGIVGPDWLAATGTLKVATSKMTVLWGVVAGVSED